MKHLERGFRENNLFIIYPAIIIVILILQGVMMLPILGFLYFNYNITEPHLFLDVLGLLKQIDANIALAALMIPMALSFFILVGAIWFVHKRSFAETVNGTKKVRWQRVFWGFGVWAVLMALSLVIAFFVSPEELTLQFDLKQFIPLVFISILLIPLQTTCEEVMFRGYLAQGVGTWTKSRWLALLIPSLIFAVLHLGNPEIEEYGLGIMFSTYLLMGLLWGLTSILDDGIEIAIGAHAANNIFISLFTSQKGAIFETDAVFKISKTDPYASFVELLVMGSIVILFFAYKYKWSFSTLNKKVEKPSEANASVI